MKTEQEQIEAIYNLIISHLFEDTVYSLAEQIYRAGYGDVSEYKAEIERLKNANNELVDNLVFYKDKSYKLERTVDKLKTEIDQEVKQAQIDVLNKLRSRASDRDSLIQSYIADGCLTIEDMYIEIDELIKEIKNDKERVY